MQGMWRGERMDKQDAIRRFSRETGALFIEREEVKKLMHYKDAHSVDYLLKGLGRTKHGKKYYIPDVIERIKEDYEFV